MHFVVFGLSISSSWGNGHATLWRGLIKALAQRGHTLMFYEKDLPYYASNRDGWQPPTGARLRLYQSWAEIQAEVRRELAHADVALATSYCPDGIAASRALLDSRAAVKTFYDLDTPVTLSGLHAGADIPYLLPEGLGAFDLVLSYTGGRALEELRTRLGAREVAPLYGWVDAETHAPAPPVNDFRSQFSYLGTFALDRQNALEELFIRAAIALPQERFTLGGAQYPESFPWTENIHYVRHLPPAMHPAFFCSSRATLNVTRAAMARYGFCPSGRLFEAAACGVPLLSDWWEGIETFFEPGREILPVRRTVDTLAALSLTDRELQNIAAAARARTLECHTATRRAIELESICDAFHAHSLPSSLTA